MIERSVPGAGLGAQRAKGYEGVFLGGENSLDHDYSTCYITVFFKTHSNYALNIGEIYCV